MLSEEIIDKLVERLVNRIEQGNAYVLEKIGKSIKAIKDISPSQIHQLNQMLKYGGDYEKIAKKLAEIANMNVADIYTIFEEVAKRDYAFAEQFYKYRGVNYIPYEKNIDLQMQVRALAQATANEYVNFSKTSVIGFTTTDLQGRVIFKDLSTTYQEAIDTASLSVMQGKTTYGSEITRLVKELGESGLKTVDYASGRSMRLDSALRMNLKGALRDTHNYLQEQFGNEFGADGIEISAHEAPAIDHEDLQGKQFEKMEFIKLQSGEVARDYKGNTYQPTIEDNGTSKDRRPISKMNCYHTTFQIVLGVNEPLYTDEQLKQIIDENEKGFDFDGKHYTNYEGTQLQRRIETEVRKQKDIQIMARASGEEELAMKAQKKINQLTQKYDDLHKASDLSTRMERLTVSGYRKIKVRETDTK